MSTLAHHRPQAQSEPEAADGAGDQALILLNPRSFRMSLRQRVDRIRSLAGKRTLAIVEASEPGQMQQALNHARKAGCRLIIVVGGDGTLQGVVTLLAASQATPPNILMLGGGRTNYTARDIGTSDQLLATLEAALDDPGKLSVTSRQSLELDHPDIGIQHGFFLAAALVDFVIRDAHRFRSQGSGLLRTGHLSSAICLSRLAALGLIGRSGFVAPELSIDAGALGLLEGPTRLLIATTLTHQADLIDPYIAVGDGPVRLTAVLKQAQGFWRRLPRLMRGHHWPGMNTRSGYLSGRCEEVRVHGLTGIALDGQEFDLDPGIPLSIRPGPMFRFLHR